MTSSLAVLALALAQMGVTVPLAGSTSTPPPEIAHTVTSARCDTLHGTMLPVGYVTKRNDAAFRAMSRSMVAFLSGIYPTDVPSKADMQAAAYQPKFGNNTGTSDAMGSEEDDDQLLYGPGQVLTAAEIDNVAEQVHANIVVEQKFIDQSWKSNPRPRDPNVSQMRQRAQNLVDLQRALADQYERFDFR